MTRSSTTSEMKRTNVVELVNIKQSEPKQSISAASNIKPADHKLVPAENPLPDTNVSKTERPAIVYQPVSSVRNKQPAPITRQQPAPTVRKHQPGPSVTKQLASLLFNIRTFELFLDCFLVVVIPAIFLVNAAILVEHYQLEILEIIDHFTAERPTYYEEILSDEEILAREAARPKPKPLLESLYGFTKELIRSYKNEPSQPILEPFYNNLKDTIRFIKLVISCYQK